MSSWHYGNETGVKGMENKLVTVVVPIYNVEKYLNECIESIVGQTYKNLEILLIDDGSTDSCPRICDEWAEKDARIRVIHKQNQGLGMARNTGIDNASGRYICFYDSDDYVDRRVIEKAYEKAEEYSAEIVLYGLKDFTDDGSIIDPPLPKSPKSFYKGYEVQKIVLPDLIDSSFAESSIKGLPFSAWSCLFSMELIRRSDWKFVSERQIISEDSYSLIELYKQVKSIFILHEALYYHRWNFHSLSRTYRQDRFERTKHFYLKAVRLAKDCMYDVVVENRLSGLFFNFIIDIMKQTVAARITFIEKIQKVRQIVCDDETQKCARRIEYGQHNTAKKILQKLIKHKMFLTVYLLVRIKNRNTKSEK